MVLLLSEQTSIGFIANTKNILLNNGSKSGKKVCVYRSVIVLPMFLIGKESSL